MRIGIGAMLVHPLRKGGAETYARQLLKWIPQLDPDNEYVVFVPAGSDFVSDRPNVEVITSQAPVASPYGRVLWEHTRLASVMRKFDLDLAHFPGSTAPQNYRGPAVVSMLDTMRYTARKFLPTSQAWYYEWIQRKLVRKGFHVIAISQAEADVFERELRIPSGRLTITYLGVDERFAREREALAAPPPKSYVLWTGNLYPHKNLKVLIEAYRLLKERNVALPPLVLNGVRPAAHAELKAQANLLGVGEYLDIRSSCSFDALPQLFRDALLYCVPSYYEGFSLPILEAMASGTAVVGSNMPCFSELYGDAIVQCDPDSKEQFANAIERMLVDPSHRAKYEQRGIKCASKYTWQKCAEATMDVYRRILV